MVKLTAYAIRHKPTGKFIPPIPRGQRRGGSWVEPEDGNPRIFFSEKSAKGFLSAWLQGIFKMHTPQFSSGWDPPEEEITVVKQPHRKKEDMEIVKLNVCEAS